MNYSSYPIGQADFYVSQVKQQIEAEKKMSPQEFQEYEKMYIPHQKKQLSLVLKGNGLVLRDFKLKRKPTISGGFHKPIGESCTQITGLTGPDEGTTALFNNLTRRKSLVKDY